MSDDLKTLVAQEVAKQLAAITADQTTKKVLEFLKNHNSALAYVVDKGESGGIRWRIWSDGLIEQWMSDRSENKAYTFPKPFSSDNYCVIGIGFLINEVAQQFIYKRATGFSTDSSGHATATDAWYAIGY
nr:MAG TPA_asm: putative tail fiber protein [Caudoviricetes sp.]